MANINGTPESDNLSGTAEGDFIIAGAGNDAVFGGAGNDEIHGEDGDDTLFGQAGDDQLYGESGNDLLRGDGGNDELFGGDGNDNLRGGAGIDSFDGGSNTEEDNQLSTYGDRISFYEGGATQGVVADLRTGIISNDGFGNVENMVGIESLGSDTAFVDTFYGNDGRNAFLANKGDYLYGFGGDDDFYITSAAALVDGGDGVDRLDLGSSGGWLMPDSDGDGFAEVAAAATSGWVVDLSTGYVKDGYGNVGSVAGIENVGGSGLGDTLVGDDNANTLSGGTGDDVLIGLGGDDLLEGGSGHDYLEGNAGNDSLQGGDDDDYLYGNAGDDLLNGGNGFDRVGYSAGATTGVTVDLNIVGVAQDTGSQGWDTLIGVEHVSGTRFNDVLTGDGGDNWLWGGSNGSGITGDDIISAGAGNDLVDVGNGNHQLDGGSGIDTLGLDGNGTDITVAGVTVSLALQGAGQDTEQGVMDLTGFENLSGSLYDDHLTGDDGDNLLAGYAGADTLIGGAGNDVLLGDGVVTPDTHANGGSGPIITINDVGANADDVLEGGEGDDTLIGGGGNDVLDGGTGGDHMVGGTGDDVYVVDQQGTETQAGDGVVENADEGVDEIRTSLDWGLVDNVENLTATGSGNTYLGGNSLDNVLTGNVGDNYMVGEGGNDYIDGGDGRDIVAFRLPAGTTGTLRIAEGAGGTLIVQLVQADGNFEDVFLVTPGSPGNATVTGLNSMAHLGTDTITNVEDLHFYIDNWPDPIADGQFVNMMLVPYVPQSPDFLHVTGSVGDDTIDLATLYPDVAPGTPVNANGGFGDDTIFGNEDGNYIEGNSGNDTIDGRGGDDALIGGDGDDSLSGEGGNDFLNGQAGNDTLNGGFDNDTLIGAAGSDTLNGGEGDDILVGAYHTGFGPQPGDGADILRGDGGNDLIRGGDGDDLLEGGDGNDNLRGDAGSDTLDGGAGEDFVSYVFTSLGSGITFDARAITSNSIVVDPLGGTDTLIDIESIGISGTEFDDVLRGSEHFAPTSFWANQMYGNGGNDQMFGAANNDYLNGGAGDDSLDGGSGNDFLDGGTGADVMVGGGGDDTYIVDQAGDAVIEAGDGGTDEIGTSIDWGLGGTNVENLTAIGTGNIYLGGSEVDNVITGNVGDNYMVGEGGDDVIDGGDGRDIVAFRLPAGTTGTLRIAETGGGGFLVQLVQEDGTSEDVFSVQVSAPGSATITGLNSMAGLGTDTVTNVEDLHFYADTWPAETPEGQFVNMMLVPYVPQSPDFLHVTGSVGDDTIDLAAIYPDVAPGTPVNANGGFGDDTIFGNEDGNYIEGNSGNDTIDGRGGDDALIGGDGNDSLSGEGGNDWLDGGDGNDQINGGDGNDNFVGGAGDDVIGGGSGDDYIVGEDGSDTIDGGDGHDIVAFRLPEGTPGLLRIVVGTGADEGKLIVERVVDGLVVEQVYRVTVTAESATVEGLGSAAGQGTDVVTNYEQLHFYINGANQHVGINSPFLGTSGADFPGGDWNSDVMFGGDGEDGIFGGAGADIILGEGGDDYYLQGAGGDDYISGGDGHDFINGQAGNDWVKGDSGDDYVNGAGGDDIIDGGEGHDRTGYYHVNASLGGVTVSLLLQGQWQDTGIWGQDFLVSIEAVSGTPFGDTLTGDDAGNWLWGSSSFYEPYGPGNGVVQSTTNNDVISGGGGDDLIQVGAGNHTLDGGDGSDWLAYNENGNETVGATVSLALQGQAQDTGVGSWTIGGFENLDGSRVGDHLTGDAGDNILGGGGGDDVLIGGSGNDRLLGDGGAALDTNGYAGPVSYIDDYGNVVGNDTLEGGEGDDTLIGGGGNDVLDGGTGGDHMVGGTGDDVYVVDQYWTETQVGDSVVENADEGVDEVRTWLNWGLGDDNLENLTALGSADLYLGGNALANVITGNAGNNYMVGSGGNDQIEGGDGRDTAAFHLPAGTTGSLRIAEAPDGTLLVQLVQANGTFENMFSVVIEGSGSATVTGLGLAAHLGTDTVTNVEELHFMVDTWPDPTPQDQFTFLSLSVTDFGGYVAGSSADDVIDLADYPGANNVGGGLGDDVITGAVGSSDYMRGDQGNDVITGNGGSDFDVAAYGLPAPMSGTLRVVAGTGADVGKLLVERVDGETVETLFIVSFDEAGTATVVGVNSAAFLGTDTVTGVRSIDFTVDNPEWDPAQFAHILAPASVSDGNDLAGGSNESDFIAAGSGDDQLRGNGGDDVLFGGDGNDLFRGGRGVDYFDGGADYPENSPVNGTFGDRISFFEVAATQGVIADLRTGIISNDGFGNIEAMVGIESLGGDTAFVDTFYGNDNANWLLGSRGDNLYGFGGNDSFQLSAAAAVIDGGEGHDALYLNASGGWLTPDTNGDGFAEGMAAPTAGFTVNLAAGTIGDGYGNNGIITGFEAIYGSHLTDTLIGNFADNSLYGGDGDDTLVGLGGNDVLDGGVGHDFVEGSAGNDIVRGGDGDDYLYGNAGDDLLDGGNGFDRVGYAAGATSGVTVDLNLQGVAQDTGSQGFDTLVGIENVSGTIFNDVLTGDAGDNWLWGGSDGTGVTGDDIISAGAGNDLVDVGNGNHVLDGGDGIDSLGLDGNGTDITEAGVTVSLALQGAAQDTEQGMMTLTGFENLSGSLYDDHLTGDDGDNVLAGYAGADTLVGGKGNDTILGDGLITPDTHGIGRSGPITTLNDVGANADDTLEGGEGDDTLIGGGGNDHLDGGTGNADTALFDLPAAGAGSLSIVDGTGEQAGMKLVVVTDGEASTTLATIAITDGVVTVTGTDAAAALGTDTLTNIDRLVFKAVDGASVELNIGTGVVADGLVAGATVFMDADGDGMLDEGEAFTTTAADGSFSFLSAGSGPIVAIGGVNTDTGLPNLVTLTAPEGSSVVNPITTLINAVIAGGDASSPEEAAQIVASAFGIDGSIDLLNLDLVTAAAEGNQAALDAQKIAVQIVAIMVTASDAGDSESADLALANLASLATETAEGDTLDLADTAVLAEALDGAVPPESIETITEGLSDTLEQIENADSLDELSDVQAQALTTGNDLDNLIVGGAQEDELFGLGGNDILVGGAGADVLNGGAGIDTANYATAPFDVRKQQGVIINLTSGQNKGSDADGDRLIDIENVRGSQFADTLVGNSGANQLWGELGDDSLSGNAGDDTIDGGGGNDQIRGGSGLDSLIGGEGSDLFLFGSADEISIKVGGQWLSDVILDFDAGGESASSSVDRIDLSGLDAISKSKSDDAFSFIGDGAFTGVAGQLHALATGTDEQGRTIYLIEGDMNGDSIADFQLSVHATGILGAGDFIF